MNAMSWGIKKEGEQKSSMKFSILPQIILIKTI
jgi:hypothetical protein